MPKDPALEHIDALAGLPFQAFPGQEHRAHITAHLNFLATNMVRTAPMVMASVEKNCLEHISLMAQEQIELEFKEELQQLAQMQQMAQQNPQIQQQMAPLQQKIEARKAVLIAEMMEDFKNEEKKVESALGLEGTMLLYDKIHPLMVQDKLNVFLYRKDRLTDED